MSFVLQIVSLIPSDCTLTAVMDLTNRLLVPAIGAQWLALLFSSPTTTFVADFRGFVSRHRMGSPTLFLFFYYSFYNFVLRDDVQT